MSGTMSNGTVAVGFNCGNWSSNPMASDTMAVGSPEGGPLYWAFPPIGAGLGCGTTYRLVCMGTKKNAAIPAPSVNGMLIWVSEPFFYLETGAPGATLPIKSVKPTGLPV